MKVGKIGMSCQFNFSIFYLSYISLLMFLVCKQTCTWHFFIRPQKLLYFVTFFKHIYLFAQQLQKSLHNTRIWQNWFILSCIIYKTETAAAPSSDSGNCSDLLSDHGSFEHNFIQTSRNFVSFVHLPLRRIAILGTVRRFFSDNYTQRITYEIA